VVNIFFVLTHSGNSFDAHEITRHILDANKTYFHVFDCSFSKSDGEDKVCRISNFFNHEMNNFVDGESKIRDLHDLVFEYQKLMYSKASLHFFKSNMRQIKIICQENGIFFK
jgi:hypothetical protein